MTLTKATLYFVRVSEEIENIAQSRYFGTLIYKALCSALSFYSSDKRGGRLNFPETDVFPPDSPDDHVVAPEQRHLDHEDMMMMMKYVHDPRPEYSGSGQPPISISPSGSLAPAPPVPPPIVLPPAPPPPAPISK